MRALVYSTFLIMAFTLLGCSAMEIRTDYMPAALENMAQYRTYAVLPNPKGGDPRVHNEIVAARVMSAVDRELTGGGYEKDLSGTPDFLIGYHAALDGKLDVTTTNEYYGYGYGDWYNSWRHETVVREYTEGTLILDIVDARSNSLVWRGQAQAEVISSASPETRQKRIDEAVRRILERFPPKR
jgi:hypothetical protein